MVKHNHWQAIYSTIGKAAAWEQLAEEAAELSAAAAKMARILRGDNPARATEDEAYRKTVEELADTINAVDVLDVGLFPEKSFRTDAWEEKPWKMSRWYNSLFKKEAAPDEQG